jgi:hypothetical protein
MKCVEEVVKTYFKGWTKLKFLTIVSNGSFFYSVAVICKWLELVVTVTAKHWSPQELWNAEVTAVVDLTVSSHCIQAPAIGHTHESVCTIMIYCPKISLCIHSVCALVSQMISPCMTLFRILHHLMFFTVCSTLTLSHLKVIDWLIDWTWVRDQASPDAPRPYWQGLCAPCQIMGALLLC